MKQSPHWLTHIEELRMVFPKINSKQAGLKFVLLFANEVAGGVH